MGCCDGGDRVFRVVDTTRHLGLPIKIACVVISLITALTVTFSLYFLPLGAAIHFMIISIAIGALGVAASYFGRPVISIVYIVVAVLIDIPVLVIIGFLINQITWFDECVGCQRLFSFTTLCYNLTSYQVLLCDQGLGMLWAALIIALISLGCTSVSISAFRKLRLFQMGITNTVIERGHGDKVTHVRGGAGGLDRGQAVGAAVAMERIDQLDPEIVTNQPRRNPAQTEAVQQNQPSPMQLAPAPLPQQQYSQSPLAQGLPQGAVPTAGGYFIPYPPSGIQSGLTPGGLVVQGGVQPPSYQPQGGGPQTYQAPGTSYQGPQGNAVPQSYLQAGSTHVEQTSNIVPPRQSPVGHNVQYAVPPGTDESQYAQPPVVSSPVKEGHQRTSYQNRAAFNVPRYTEPPVEAKVIMSEQTHQQKIYREEYSEAVTTNRLSFQQPPDVSTSTYGESRYNPYRDEEGYTRQAAYEEPPSPEGSEYPSEEPTEGRMRNGDGLENTCKPFFPVYSTVKDTHSSPAQYSEGGKTTSDHRREEDLDLKTDLFDAAVSPRHSFPQPPDVPSPTHTQSTRYDPYRDEEGYKRQAVYEEPPSPQASEHSAEQITEEPGRTSQDYKPPQRTSFEASDIPYDPYRNNEHFEFKRSGFETDTFSTHQLSYKQSEVVSSHGDFVTERKQEAYEEPSDPQVLEQPREQLIDGSRMSPENFQKVQKTSFTLSDMATETHSSNVQHSEEVQTTTKGYDPYSDEADYKRDSQLGLEAQEHSVDFSSSLQANVETKQKTSFAVSRISTDTHLSSGLYCEPPVEVLNTRYDPYGDEEDSDF